MNSRAISGRDDDASPGPAVDTEENGEREEPENTPPRRGGTKPIPIPHFPPVRR